MTDSVLKHATTMSLTRIRPGDNPRRYFNQDKHPELVASIRLRGVLQPILIRPVDGEEGQYCVVAGGRRRKAAIEALGADADIPVIREMSDQEALEAAIDENDNREDASETEQADAAINTHDATRTAHVAGEGEAVLTPQCCDEFDTNPDCACPHEHWHIGAGGACLDIHVEEEGYTHVTIDFGDGSYEVELHGVDTLEAARPVAFSWASAVLNHLILNPTTHAGIGGQSDALSNMKWASTDDKGACVHSMIGKGRSEQPVIDRDDLGDPDTIGSHIGNGGAFDPMDQSKEED